MNGKKFEAAFEIAETSETLFPLFSAEGEKLWVPGWDYIPISGGADLHEDFIFMTSNHDFATTNAIWIVKKYQKKNHFVQFYKIEPEDKIAIVSVKCKKIGKKRSQIVVGYDYVALSQKGQDFIDDHNQNDYEAFIGQWKLLLEQYLGC